jgi:hypothetical protein
MTLYLGIAAGDILRACPDATGTYILENNAICGAFTTGGANTGQGPSAPGDGEYYFQDMNDPVANNRHDEITIGGMVNVPGTDTVAITAFDPLPPNTYAGDNGLFDAGVIWLNNDTGVRERDFRIFSSEFNLNLAGNNFGKSNGLGDLEVVCGPPPLEIGNRVWEDLDRNGVQDPGENPIPGVILQLYMISDSFNRPVNRLIGQTTTDPNGEYYFNESNVFVGPQGVINGVPIVAQAFINFWDTNFNGTREIHEPIGIMPNAVYEVRLDNAANYGGGPLTPYFITPANTTPYNDLNDIARDSDGRNGSPTLRVSAANFPQVRLTTGDFGDNNHTYDFGFSRQTTTLTPTPPQHNNTTPTPDIFTIVTHLPDTGESPWSGWQLPALILVSGLLAAGIILVRRRWRRAS